MVSKLSLVDNLEHCLKLIPNLEPTEATLVLEANGVLEPQQLSQPQPKLTGIRNQLLLGDALSLHWLQESTCVSVKSCLIQLIKKRELDSWKDSKVETLLLLLKLLVVQSQEVMVTSEIHQNLHLR